MKKQLLRSFNIFLGSFITVLVGCATKEPVVLYGPPPDPPAVDSTVQPLYGVMPPTAEMPVLPETNTPNE